MSVEMTSTIKELLNVIAMQQEEIHKLEDRIDRIKQYIEVYEDYLKGRE